MKQITIVLKDITESGGGERVCSNLANALIQANMQVNIISLFKANEKPAYNIDVNININYMSNKSVKIKNPLKKLFYKTIYRLYLSYKVSKIIMISQPHSIIGNDGWFIPYIKTNKTKYIRIWHLNAPKKNHKNISFFDTLVVLSNKEMQIWNKYHKNVKVIPNFLPNIPNKNTDSNQKSVISVGRFTREKGFIRLIDIWKIIRNNEKYKDWKLTIVGDGVMKKEIEEKININNLQDSIILKPFTNNIESQYLSSSIYAMASHFEGFGMVLVEASSYALPCISFDIATGPSDIIQDSISGYLIEDNNLSVFANRLMELMDSKHKREYMGIQAKQIIKNNFNKDNIIKLWLNIL